MIIFVAKAELGFWSYQGIIIWRMSTSDQKNAALTSIDTWTRRLFIC